MVCGGALAFALLLRRLVLQLSGRARAPLCGDPGWPLQGVTGSSYVSWAVRRAAATYAGGGDLASRRRSCIRAHGLAHASPSGQSGLRSSLAATARWPRIPLRARVGAVTGTLADAARACARFRVLLTCGVQGDPRRAYPAVCGARRGPLEGVPGSSGASGAVCGAAAPHAGGDDLTIRLRFSSELSNSTILARMGGGAMEGGDAPRGSLAGDAPRGSLAGDAPRGSLAGDAPRGSHASWSSVRIRHSAVCTLPIVFHLVVLLQIDFSTRYLQDPAAGSSSCAR
jgi:hypothetical protein